LGISVGAVYIAACGPVSTATCFVAAVEDIRTVGSKQLTCELCRFHVMSCQGYVIRSAVVLCLCAMACYCIRY